MEPKRILLIDDDENLLAANRVVLEAKGFLVEAVTTPDEGLEAIEAWTPDLVVLDLMMPADYEGFELARAVREDLGARDLPILMLTCVHDTTRVPYRFACDETYAPVDVFRDKPLAPDDLVATVREMLGLEHDDPIVFP
jgi:DNA-binding response OmpR family regulator